MNIYKFDDIGVAIVKREITSKGINLETSNKFNGQKIQHAFNGINIQTGKPCYVKPPSTNSMVSILKSCDRFDIKHDGTNGAIVWSNTLNCYEPYARFDIKKNKDGIFVSPLKTARWIPCEAEPVVDVATHWPHYRPCSEDVKGYKWYIKAFDQIKDKLKDYEGQNILSVEYIGKKFNWNHSDSVEQDCAIVIHGSIGLDIPENMRNYDGFRMIFEKIPTIEGLVAYTEIGPLKIRRDMYPDMKWPSLPKSYLTEKYGLNGLTELATL
jgi:hypothetical protein